jgi:enamine deaminase RidA (YjgF/YER057c/UK114 family)
MTKALDRLRELGFELPRPKAPVASYVPFVKSGNLLFVSGQISTGDAGVVTGRLGDTLNVVQGGNAAELAALNLLSQVHYGADIPLDSIKRVVKLTIFVNATEAFTEHHLVANGVSNILAAILGDKGKHARSSIGVSGLPFGAAVEVEGIFEV